jgi:hypothetical protein
MKLLSPLKAIRKYCVWCCNKQPKEANLCPAKTCPLNLFRFGKNPKNKPHTALKAIRLRCINCSGFILSEAKNCKFDGKIEQLCDLYHFRLGKNPNRLGKGNRNPFLQKKSRQDADINE